MKVSTKLVLALAGAITSITTILPSSLAVPPAIITQESGNIKVEVRQLGVVVQREGVDVDPSGPPTGWGSSFDQWSDLAYVRFQIRIFRNGRLVASENVGPITYRGGDLPELVEINNLDRDRDLEVRINFRDYTGAARYRVLFSYYYDWRSNRRKYHRTLTLSSSEMTPYIEKSGFI